MTENPTPPNGTQALANPQPRGMERIKTYMLSPEVKQRFTEMMGNDAIYYLNQVLILVANNEELQRCEPKSILISAMRAASLKLSVDPNQGQAWIIPYNGIATFQLGYKGVYELALRTNLYRFINVIDIFEGEIIEENRMTGMHAIRGKRTGEKVTGYLLYFKLLSGYEKTFYMSVEEIEVHARHYSKAYKSPKSKWNDPYERPKMERKTVMVNGLRKWGRFNPADKALIEEIESEQAAWTGFDALPEEDRVTVAQEPDEDPAAKEARIQAELTGEAPKAAAPEVSQLRYQPDALKAWLEGEAKKYQGRVTDTQKGLVATVLEAVLSMTTDPKASRKQLLVFLTGKDSLRDIPAPMLEALYRWLQPRKDPNGSGEWLADDMAARETIAAFNAAQPKQDGLFN